MTKPLEKVNVAFAEIFKGSCFHHVKMSLYISNVHEGKISFPCQICGKAFVVKHHPRAVLDSMLIVGRIIGKKMNIAFTCQICGKAFVVKHHPRSCP